MAPAIYKALPCPRCGSHVIGLILTGEGRPQFIAICRHCFRCGPCADNRDEALTQWNQDPARPKASLA